MNKKLYLVFAIVGVVLLYLFSRKGTGFLAPTSGNIPIEGYQGAHAMGVPLSSLPPTGLTSPNAKSTVPSDPGATYTQGPTPPPGYDPNNPSTWPAQLPTGVIFDSADPISLYGVDTAQAA